MIKIKKYKFDFIKKTMSVYMREIDFNKISIYISILPCDMCEISLNICKFKFSKKNFLA